MKKLIFVVLVLCFAASFAYAETVTINGTIIDNMCADAHKDDLAVFIKTHPNNCTVMGNAMATSGYAIYSNGKLTKFTDASSEKIAEFLKSKDSSKLSVIVDANKAGDMLDLISIRNSTE